MTVIGLVRRIFFDDTIALSTIDDIPTFARAVIYHVERYIKFLNNLKFLKISGFITINTQQNTAYSSSTFR